MQDEAAGVEQAHDVSDGIYAVIHRLQSASGVSKLVKLTGIQYHSLPGMAVADPDLSIMESIGTIGTGIGFTDLFDYVCPGEKLYDSMKLQPVLQNSRTLHAFIGKTMCRKMLSDHYNNVLCLRVKEWDDHLMPLSLTRLTCLSAGTTFKHLNMEQYLGELTSLSIQDTIDDHILYLCSLRQLECKVIRIAYI